MRALLLLLLIFVAAHVTVTKQLPGPRPDCQHTALNVSAAQLALYDVAFDRFEETADRSAWQTLVFDSLAYLSTAVGGGGDLAEMLVTLRRIAQAVAPSTVSVQQVAQNWQEGWSTLAMAVATEAEDCDAQGDISGAASAYLRAATYMQLALRFSDHRAELSNYNLSVTWFDQGLRLDAPGFVFCAPARIPFGSQGHILYGFWCPGAASSPVVLAFTGYDGSNVNTYFEVAVPAARRGMSVLMLEGPGQGWTVRQQQLFFRPDWEVVVDAAVAWLQSVPGIAFNISRLVLWGRSMGGYLAPRGFASASIPPAMLVADGGIADFFQMTFCALPLPLQTLLYSDPVTFDRYLIKAMATSLSLRSLLFYGFLGFNTSSPSELYAQWQSYRLGPERMARLAAYPVLVNAPAWDTLAGNSSRLFWAQLLPTHAQSQLLALDPLRGAGLHCDIGSTAVTVNRILAWVLKHATV